MVINHKSSVMQTTYDFSQNIKDKILGQNIKYGMMWVENRGGLQNG